jgi:hypothetical protein
VRRDVREPLALTQDCILHEGLNLHIRGIRRGRLLEKRGSSY